MKFPVVSLGFLVTLVVAAACTGGGSTAADKGRFQVVVTLPLLADFVQRVGGDRVEVTAILPPGTDPHTFELTPKAVRKLSEADIVFVNGLGLEGSALDVIENNKPGDAPLIALAKQAEATEEGVGGAIGDNPHLWLDVSLAMRYVEAIREGLSAADGPGAATYRANAADYLREMEALGEELEALVATVPAERRKLVTSHDAFPYLARYLGFQVAAVLVGSPGQEPSPQHLANLLRLVK